MHAWDIPLSQAAALQRELRSKLISEPLADAPRLIAGVDVSSNRFSDDLFAGVVVMTFPELRDIESAFAHAKAAAPYVPGFLSFREIPPLLTAFEKLSAKPDVLFVDGQGIAHPRRLGIAAHLGLVLDIPSVGVAKSVLTGTGAEPAPEAGAFEYLYDAGDVIGAKVRTKTKTKPVIVSPGHRMTVDEAIRLVLATRGAYRIPEPTRRAHEAVNGFRRSFARG